MAPEGKLTIRKPASAGEMVQAEEGDPEKNRGAGGSRDRATEELDLVLEEFQRKHKKGKPDFKALKEALTPNQKSALWMRLKKERGTADMNIKEAWNTICELKVGGMKKKQDVLLCYAMNPNDSTAWQARMMEVALTVSHTKKKTIEKTEFTKGELIQAHGYEEAMEFIDKGKYKAVKDDDGDTVYIKTKRKFTEEGAIAAKKTLNRIDTCTDKKLIQKITVYITIAFSKLVFCFPKSIFQKQLFQNRMSKIYFFSK